MLTKMELNNFKKHTKLVVEFKPGLNGIIGPNYSGKTTIMFGILYCLWGASAVPSKTIVKRGTNLGFKQELWFSIAAGNYRVLRTKSKAELYKEDEMIANGTTEVNLAISKLLGMGPKRFKQLRVARQGKTEAILSLGATELFNIVSDITGISDVNVALGSLDTMKRDAESKIEVIPVTVKSIEELRNEEKLAQGRKEAAEVHILVAKNRVSEAKEIESAALKNYQEENVRFVAYSESVNRHKGLMRRVEEAKENYSAANIRLASAKLYVVTEEDIANARKKTEELALLRGDLVSKNKIAADLKGKGSAAKEEVEVSVLKLGKAEKAVSEVKEFSQEDISALEDKYNTVRANLTALRNEAKQVKEAQESLVCTQCGRAFDSDSEAEEHKAALAMRGKEISDLLVSEKDTLDDVALELRKAEDYTKKVSLAEKEKTILISKTNHLASVEADLSSIIEYVSKHPSVQEVSQQFLDCSEMCNTLTGKLNEIRAAESKAKDAELDLENATEELAKFSFEPSEQPPTSATVENLLADLKEAQQQYKREAEELSKATVSAAAFASALEAAKAAVTSAIEHEEQRAALVSRRDIVQALVDYLRKSRDRFSSGVWDQFLGLASMFVSNCTQGKIEALGRDPDTGAFLFKEDGEWSDASDASGCQQAIMGVAIQAALADSAYCSLDILLADEITASMDAQHSLSVMVMLASSGKQVITISHEELDNSVFSNVIQLGGQ